MHDYIIMHPIAYLISSFIIADLPSLFFTRNMRLKAAYLNPNDGINKHFKYSKLITGIYITFFSLVILIFLLYFLHYYFLDANDPIRIRNLKGSTICLIIIICLCMYAIYSLIRFITNKRSGIYVFEDRIVINDGFREKCFLKKDIKEINFIGFLRRFDLILNNGKTKPLGGILTEDTTQLLCTLLLYVNDDRTKISSGYEEIKLELSINRPIAESPVMLLNIIITLSKMRNVDIFINSLRSDYLVYFTVKYKDKKSICMYLVLKTMHFRASV